MSWEFTIKARLSGRWVGNGLGVDRDGVICGEIYGNIGAGGCGIFGSVCR